MNQNELLRKLYERDSIDIDLSPGDDVCLRAYHEIRRLQARPEDEINRNIRLNSESSFEGSFA